MAAVTDKRLNPSPKARKIVRTFRLTSGKIEAAQRVLGAPTATDTIETALDMVIFREELMRGTKKALGIEFSEPKRRGSEKVRH
jgi:hypothetical protein